MSCRCRHACGAHEHIRDGNFARDGQLFGTPLNHLIDFSKVLCWNCQQTKDEVGAFLNLDVKVPPPPDQICSDADEELLIYLPFHEFARIRGISIIGAGEQYSPSRVKLYANRPEMSGFDTVQRLQPEDTIILSDVTRQDEIIYNVNAAKFMNTANLTLFFDETFGADETRVLKLILYGETTKNPVNRPLATNVVYELRPNAADHPEVEEDRKKSRLVN